MSAEPIAYPPVTPFDAHVTDALQLCDEPGTAPPASTPYASVTRLTVRPATREEMTPIALDRLGRVEPIRAQGGGALLCLALIVLTVLAALGFSLVNLA